MKYFNLVESSLTSVFNNPFPPGTMYSGAPVSLLNGLVNSTKPLSGFVLGTVDWLEPFQFEHCIYIRDEAEYIKTGTLWFEFKPINRDETFNGLARQSCVLFWPNLYAFQQNLVILSDAGPGVYAFFLFNINQHQCKIGRFQTSESTQAIIDEFEASLTQRRDNAFGARPLPPVYLAPGYIRAV